MSDIFISDKRRRRVLRLPILPENMPDISQEVQCEEFIPITGKPITIIGEVGLRTISISTLLPTRYFSFAKSNVYSTEFINLVETAMGKKEPLRLVMTGTVYVNMLVIVSSFTYAEQKSGFVSYTLDLKEYGG